MKQEAYFPFGFRYPVGCRHSDFDPDPKIETIRARMKYLNEIHAASGLPGHIFGAAMDLFQKESCLPVDQFWDSVGNTLSIQELASIAVALSCRVQDEPPRLEFPNAVAIVDCRFVATKEWEHIRRYSIGGSEAATVLELSGFQSRRSLYYEKKHPKEENRTIGGQQILDYGHRLEDYIINEVASRLGAVPFPEYRMFAHRDYSFITCNPDAIFLFPDGHFALFESKTAFWKKISDWKQGIPSYYAPQPKQYLEVFDDPKLNEGYIGVCFGGLPKHIIAHKYVRNKQEGTEQILRVATFWQDHVAADNIPAFSGKYKLDIKAAYQYIPHDPNGVKADTLSADAASAFERYFNLQAQKAAICKEKNQAHAKEKEMQAIIRGVVPEGLTICSVPNGITYQIKVKQSNTHSVNMQDLETRDPLAASRLYWLAESLKDTSLQWTTPKVTRAKC